MSADFETERPAGRRARRPRPQLSRIQGIDTSTAAGRMVAGVFASLAELERELIAERAAVAREAARVRGRQTGRPTALNAEQIAGARRMRAAGESPTTIAKTFGISRATAYRILSAA
ncbi:DNA invertase Pin-like site-specific DNA recombinase [Nocardia sp. GAS34]